MPIHARRYGRVKIFPYLMGPAVAAGDAEDKLISASPVSGASPACYLTRMVPRITPEWGLQWYGKSPAVCITVL